jgi:hypothetical protein
MLANLRTYGPRKYNKLSIKQVRSWQRLKKPRLRNMLRKELSNKLNGGEYHLRQHPGINLVLRQNLFG